MHNLSKLNQTFLLACHQHKLFTVVGGRCRLHKMLLHRSVQEVQHQVFPRPVCPVFHPPTLGDLHLLFPVTCNTCSLQLHPIYLGEWVLQKVKVPFHDQVRSLRTKPGDQCHQEIQTWVGVQQHRLQMLLV